MVVVTIYMGTTFFFNNSTPTTQPVVKTKVKASDEGFQKVVVLNNPTATPTPTVVPTGVVAAAGILTPTPTEIILAFNTPAVSNYLSPTSSFAAPVSTTSATITRMQTLPKTGFVNNSLILFAVASTLVFVAFLF
jgi:hypothetical protein